eukprot:7817555-Alexandrium_andersonii.AAC.1
MRIGATPSVRVRGLQRFNVRATALPAGPADAYRLSRSCWVNVNPQLGAQPNVAAPEVGPGPPRQALQLMMTAEPATPGERGRPNRETGSVRQALAPRGADLSS